MCVCAICISARGFQHVWHLVCMYVLVLLCAMGGESNRERQRERTRQNENERERERERENDNRRAPVCIRVQCEVTVTFFFGSLIHFKQVQGSMGRTPAWEHADGPAASVRALAAVLEPWAQELVDANINLYPSDDFKVGLSSEHLQKYNNLLLALIKLDPRGGLFGHLVMTEAVAAAIRFSDLQQVLVAKALAVGRPVDEVKSLIAYKLRVMLAHIRSKFDSQTPGSSLPGLEQVFEVLQSPARATHARKARRIERLGHRPHPFVHFRTQATEDEEPMHLAIVSKFFDGKVARILREDGSQTSADMYKPGPNGFVIAKWVEEQEELELEVPNSCCKEGLLQIGMAAEKVMKKPAAMQAEAASSSHDPSGDVENKEKDQEAVKKGEEEEALEQEEEEQADENEVEGKQHEFEFKVVAGHGTEMTIVVKGIGKDKAQVLAIRGSTFAGTDWTPRTACQHIAGELQKEAAKVTSPVATCAFLPDLRKLAAAMKQGLCDNT